MKVKKRQQGFSLAVVLMLITVMGGFLVGLTNNNRGTLRQKAEISGWELAQISRAARIYARNQISLNPNLSNDLSPAGSGPQDVTIDTLISEALLPENFVRQLSGTRRNAFGQEIRVILANFPIDGDPLDVTTVPTAYVYVENNEKVNGSIIQDMVQEIRRQGVSVSAPLFNGGTNTSGDCEGRGNTAILWDTGCMAEVDFMALTGDNFEEGDFVVPTWRAVNFDTRAVMRFPSPENTGLPTMLTELEMGTQDCTSFIQTPSDNGMIDSSICDSIDDSTGVDNRRDITGVQNVVTSSLLVDPQAVSDSVTSNLGVISSRAEETYALNINGRLDASGDAKIYQGNVNIGRNLTADKNIFATKLSGDTGSPVSASIGSLETGDTTSSDLVIANTPSVDAGISIQKNMIIPGYSTITDSFLARQLDIDGDVNVSGDANMLGTTRVQNTNINGSSDVPYDYVTGSISGENITYDGNVNIAESLNIRGTSNISRLDITNGGTAECLGDCPRRELADFCNNITGMSYAQCMATF